VHDIQPLLARLSRHVPPFCRPHGAHLTTVDRYFAETAGRSRSSATIHRGRARLSAAGVGSHVVSQRNRQLGAARAPHRRILADHCVRSAIPQTNPLARCEHLGRAEGVVRASKSA
jgi:hypothetical protein